MYTLRFFYLKRDKSADNYCSNKLSDNPPIITDDNNGNVPQTDFSKDINYEDFTGDILDIFKSVTTVQLKKHKFKPQENELFLNAVNSILNKHYIEAITILEELTTIEPDAFLYNFSLGVSYLLNIDLKKAAQKLSSNLKHEPTHKESHYLLSFIFYLMKDLNLSYKHIIISKTLNFEIEENMLRKQLFTTINNNYQNISNNEK